MSGSRTAKKKKGRLVKLAEARRQQLRKDWAERNPQKARAERELRKSHRQARKDFPRGIDGTPETRHKARRTRQGALSRLYTGGSITIDQLAAAGEIVSVHERLTGDVRLGTVSLETRVDQSRHGDGAFFERLGAVRAEVAYTAWRARLEAAEPVLAMIVDDVGVSVAARHFRMRNARAKAMLCSALDLWRDMMSDACRDIDEATLLAAQAGIL